MYIDKQTLSEAVKRLHGTAGHLLKIWLTLKHMGLSIDSPAIEINTSNSTPSLKRLFSCGSEDGSFYVPFAHTKRYSTMKSDAARSIVQTTVQRWSSSGSVVTCDPTGYIDIETGEDKKLLVSTGRRYPFGLGISESGFATDDESRVSIPLNAFAVWYGRSTAIPDSDSPAAYLVESMLDELNISTAERSLIFVDDTISVSIRNSPLTNTEILETCQPFIDGELGSVAEVWKEDLETYSRKVNSLVSSIDLPSWMRTEPSRELRDLLDSGSKAVLLFGAPRTGKTRQIDEIIPRSDKTRTTIQIHDGWSYDHLVEGLKPAEDGSWAWTDGPLKEAIKQGKKFVVLEEINRTLISQAMGEIFSLIEDSYRGENNGIVLRSGEIFWIPSDVVFIMTMNTLDKSTEDVDDALLGRVASVEFPPRVEDLNEILQANRVNSVYAEKVAQLFSAIQDVYPLGHGYFAGLEEGDDNAGVIRYYKSRVRPVLGSHFGELQRLELSRIDNLVDEYFGKA